MKSKKYLVHILASLLFFVFAGNAYAGDAGNPRTLLGEVTTTATLQTTSIQVTVGSLIKAVLGLLGVILLIIVIYAGFLWMTAGGDSEKVKKSKQLLTNAVIGMVIVFGAYAITDFILKLAGV